MVGGSGRRDAVALISALVVVAGLIWVVLKIRTSNSPVNTATEYGTYVGAVTLSVSLLGFLGRWWWKGRRATGVVNRLARALADTQAPRQVDRSRYDIGGDAPGWKGVFQQAFNDLAQHRLWLGDPVTEVYPVGPGVVQHFQTPTELFGWVLYARPNQPPVAVAGEVWQALQDEGSAAPDGDALGALGFPTSDPATTRVVDRRTPRVELSGGRWGPRLASADIR